MAVITYEAINPSLIESTTMRKKLYDGVHRTTLIAPNEGYALHVKGLDYNAIDEETGLPSEEITLGYKTTEISMGYNYDFDNVVAGFDGDIPVNKVGREELYTIPLSSVPNPENQIFGGGGNNDHEIM